MKSVEEIRQVIITKLKTLLTASFSSVKVAYPNNFNIDLENFTDNYFINVDLEIADIDAGDVGNSDISVSGSLIVHAVFTVGKGWAGTGALTDSLVSNFVSKKASEIDYTTMKVYNTAPYPGYKGRKHVIKFICN